MQSEIQEIRATPTDYLEPGVETCFHHHALQRILLVPRPQKNNAEICYVMLLFLLVALNNNIKYQCMIP